MIPTAAGTVQAKTSTIVNDLVASLVVFLVALPLCMGIAIASGLPPALGLATGVIGGLVVGAVSGSPLQVSGPAAGLAVVLLETVNQFGIASLGVIVLLAGALQLIAGHLKLGQWFRAISPAVVYGMLAGIGILIAAGQFHVMIDDKARGTGLQNILAIPESLFKALAPPEGTNHHYAAAIGLLTFVSILLWNKLRPNALKVLPGTLVGIVLATAVTAMFQVDIKHVQIPDNIWSVFTFPTHATFSKMLDPRAVLTIVTIAVIASAETMLSAAAVDRMQSGVRTNYDKELRAQGIGNILCGIIGAPAMTGVIVRSSANVQAGARTRLSAILHGAWLMAFVLLFPGVLRLIPMASLAGILVFTGMKLVNLDHLRNLRAYGPMPVFIYAATVIGIVSVDLLTGVLVGLGLTVVKLIWKASRMEIHNVLNHDLKRADLHVRGIATFIRLPALLKTLDRVPATYQVHVHIQNLYYIDHTTLDMLKATAAQRAASGGNMHVHWEDLARRYDPQQHYDLPHGDLRHLHPKPTGA